MFEPNVRVCSGGRKNDFDSQCIFGSFEIFDRQYVQPNRAFAGQTQYTPTGHSNAKLTLMSCAQCGAAPSRRVPRF